MTRSRSPLLALCLMATVTAACNNNTPSSPIYDGSGGNGSGGSSSGGAGSGGSGGSLGNGGAGGNAGTSGSGGSAGAGGSGGNAGAGGSSANGGNSGSGGRSGSGGNTGGSGGGVGSGGGTGGASGGAGGSSVGNGGSTGNGGSSALGGSSGTAGSRGAGGSFGLREAGPAGGRWRLHPPRELRLANPSAAQSQLHELPRRRKPKRRYQSQHLLQREIQFQLRQRRYPERSDAAWRLALDGQQATLPVLGQRGRAQ